MDPDLILSIGYYTTLTILAFYLLYRVKRRLELSVAKHPSLRGHARWSRRIAKWVPYFSYKDERFFSCDSAPKHIAKQRQHALDALTDHMENKCPISISTNRELNQSISDVPFTNRYCVPFPFQEQLSSSLKAGILVKASKGVKVQDVDGNWYYDATGSYGVNVFGYDFYKECIKKGSELVEALGPVLGSYHPVIYENAKIIKKISELDEVSFHMSGTEAVMQAVRLARYHTNKTHLVRLCGSYHGWWDGVQPGVGNQRNIKDAYTLRDLDNRTLTVLKRRNDIACILINPMQAMHPNASAASDSTLIASDRQTHFNREQYTEWLQEIRTICSEKGIILIFDEVFTGFRLGYRGAQEYFDIQADMVTYGKTLGGGLPVGVLCGKKNLMQRYKQDKPAHINFARGTFNSHPYVLGAMNTFLKHIETPEVQNSYKLIETIWDQRTDRFNRKLKANRLPLFITNMHSVLSVNYTIPSRYNWMLQFYLKSAGLELSWIGTGRMIFSFDYTEQDFDGVIECFIEAGKHMQNDAWWWEQSELSNKAIKRQFLKDLVHARSPMLSKMIPEYKSQDNVNTQYIDDRPHTSTQSESTT